MTTPVAQQKKATFASFFRHTRLQRRVEKTRLTRDNRQPASINGDHFTVIDILDTVGKNRREFGSLVEATRHARVTSWPEDLRIIVRKLGAVIAVLDALGRISVQ